MDSSATPPKIPPHILLLTLIGSVLSLAVIIYGLLILPRRLPSPTSTSSQFSSKLNLPLTERVEKFKSVDDFKDYLAKSPSDTQRRGLFDANLQMLSMPTNGGVGIGAPLSKADYPYRYSATNVQVQGIDEPDIVKTDGKRLYYSRTGYSGSITPLPILERRMPVPPSNSSLDILTAFPPDSLTPISQINQSGNLLLHDNFLVVFSPDNRRVTGYNVKDPKNPQEIWRDLLSDNNSLVSARLYKGKVFLVTSAAVNRRTPCPYYPIEVKGERHLLPCDQIYHPVSPVPADTTYTAMAIDIPTGQVKRSAAFVASSNSSVVYMSEDSLYLSYSYQADAAQLFYNFFSEKASDLISPDLLTRLKELSGYNLSSASKLTELMYLLESYRSSLSDNDRLKFENEMSNRMQTYAKDHQRDLEFTGIVKFDPDNLSLRDVGRVPGHPLNQFSFDEYQNHLRVATTIGSSWLGSFGSSSIPQVNDVYVLNSKLAEVGSIKGLGETERIYSVRFIADRGYVVTFRQVDPFYILDLSRPGSPTKTGELKIPGYSSYLHPVDTHRILGLGKEGSQVKLSLFDVADSHNPREISKYTLSEYSSEALTTHHAFLHDPKYSTFFLPATTGAYVFSYSGDTLSLKSAVSDIGARRAVFIADYLYILSDAKILVLDQRSGQSVKEFTFP